jgi:heptosyltransferase-2
MKALVIQTAFLGDAIISLSLAEELKRLSPQSEISYLVRPESAPIIRLSPSVDKVFTFDKYKTESGISGIKNKAFELNKEGFDTIFTLHSSKRTMMLIERLNAHQKIGYGMNDNLTIKFEEQPEQQTARGVRLLTTLFPNANLKTLPKLLAKEESLPKAVLQLPKPIVAIAPDSVWKTKQWRIEHFKQLIKRLSENNFSIILVGSNLEVYKKFNSFNLLYNNILNLLSKTSLEELVSIISYSDLLIANDSAPIHIATATRIPSIVLFGPTISEFGFAPPPELGKIVQNEGLWCRPCASHGSNECPIHTHECMTTIDPEKVFELATQFITSVRDGSNQSKIFNV